MVPNLATSLWWQDFSHCNQLLFNSKNIYTFLFGIDTDCLISLSERKQVSLFPKMLSYSFNDTELTCITVYGWMILDSVSKCFWLSIRELACAGSFMNNSSRTLRRVFLVPVKFSGPFLRLIGEVWSIHRHIEKTYSKRTEIVISHNITN